MSQQRQVVIADGVVRRPVKPWTPTVQALLTHLYDAGLPVPEPRGFDSAFEYVGLVEGDAGEDAWRHQLSDAGVLSAGALLRRIHDATRGWQPPTDAVWSVRPEPAGEPADLVICHGDPQPGNLAWSDGRAVGIFDWDASRPAPRLSDVAYGLLWFAPYNADAASLRRRGLGARPNRRARAEAFLDGYGWTESLDIGAVALRRHLQAVDEVVELGSAGHEPAAT